MSSPFGQRLRALRQAAGFTQEELAERAGMTAAGISAIERGTRRRTYSRTVNALADALGLAGQDRDVFGALARQPPPGASRQRPAAGVMLPAQPTTFIGREWERAQVRLSLERARLITVAGPAGIGKTRLALEVASEASNRFAAGVRVAELGPVLDRDLVTYAVARSLGIVPRTPGSPLALSAAHLGEAHILLVLDNCEHVVQAAAEAAASLLNDCPQLVILATSREPLRVPGEVVLQVGPLPADESAALLQARAAGPAGTWLGATHQETVQGLLAGLDGIPLAIELAAAALRAFTPDQILGELDRGFGELALGSRIAPPRHHSLAGAIGWSYELLQPDERRLWRDLSVFAGGFELAAACEVCSSPELAAERVPAILAALVEKSVVQRDERGRFRMLEAVRQYGHRQLLAAGEEADLARRHRDWAAALAWPRLEIFWGPQEAAWRDRFEAEQANLRAALDACVRARDARAGLAIFTGLHGLWQTRAGISEGLRWFDVLIALDGPEDDIRSLALCWAAWLHALIGDLPPAIRAGREAERIARKIGDSTLRAYALQNLAYAHLAGREATAAINLARRAVKLHRSAGNQFGVAAALHHLAYAHLILGEGPQSRNHAEEALHLCQAVGNQKIGIAMTNLLATIAWQDGDTTAAVKLAAKAIAAAGGGAGDEWSLARALQILGCAAAAAGQPGRAATLFGATASLLHSIQDDSDPARLTFQDDAESQAKQALGEAGYARRFAAGFSLPAADITRYARETSDKLLDYSLGDRRLREGSRS